MKPETVFWLLIAIASGILLLFGCLVSAAFSFDVPGPEIDSDHIRAKFATTRPQLEQLKSMLREAPRVSHVADDQVNQFRIGVHTVWWAITENSGIDQARHEQYRRLLREVGARDISKDKSTLTIKVRIGSYGMVGSGLGVFYFWCPGHIPSMQRVRSVKDLPRTGIPGYVASVSLADDWFVLYER